MAQQLTAGPAVTVLTGHRPAVPPTSGGGLDEFPEGRGWRTGSRCGRARNRRRNARRDRSRPCGQQRLELAQVGAQPSGGTAAPPSRASAGAPAGVRPPSPAPSSRIRHSAAPGAPGRPRSPGSRRRRRSARRVAASATVSPAAPRSASPRRAAGPAPRPRRVAGARRRPAARPGPPSRSAGAAAARAPRPRPRPCRDSRAREGPRRRPPDQPHGGPEHHRQRALGADQGLGHVAPARAAGVPASSRTPAGRSGRTRCGWSPGSRRPGAEPGVDRRRRVGAGRASARPAVSRCRGRHQVEGDDVVSRPAVAQRPRAAGVVADHPADGAPGLGGRVGTEAQAVGGGGGGDVVEDRAGLDHGGAGVGVQLEHAVEVPGEVQDHASADRVPAVDVPPPREVTGTPSPTAARAQPSTSSVCRG